MSKTVSVKETTDKYTIIVYTDGTMEALRHGEPWRDSESFIGDGLVMSLAHSLEEARNAYKEIEEELMQLSRYENLRELRHQ